MELDIGGHKAKIDFVSARQADGIWNKEDYLLVSLTLEEAAEAVIGFAVRLPVKRYGREEFLAKVKAEAEDTLPKIVEKHVLEREKFRRESERQEVLDAVVAELKSEIGLPE